MIDFVNCPYRHGELSPCEREALYRWVFAINPRVIVEIGTGKGGSTCYMAQAIKDNDIKCRLFTCDPKRKPVKEFFIDYPFVDYRRAMSNVLLEYIRLNGIIPEFIFFDGPDDARLALKDFRTLNGISRKGTYFSMHDWECNKASQLKPYIDGLRFWKKVEIIGNRKDSVGLCLYKKIHD